MLKGLFKNSEIDNIPPGYCFHAKNAINSIDGQDAYVNEKGTVLMTVLNNNNFDALWINGVIVYLNYIIVFGKLNTGQEFIIAIDEDDDTVHSSIVKEADPVTGTAFFSFAPIYPISGIAKLNPEGEIIVVFYAANMKPKYVNLSKDTTATNGDLLNLNLTDSLGFITDISTEEDGAVEAGAYFITYRLLTEDYDPTRFAPLIGPIYINNDSKPVASGGTTSKSIKVTFNFGDSLLTKLELAVVKSVKGVVTAQAVKYVDSIGSSTTVTYNGVESSAYTLTLAEIIQNNIILERIQALTTVDNNIYAGRVKIQESKKEGLYQYLLDNFTVQWSSLFITANNNSNKKIVAERATKGLLKSYIHDEVYAIFLQPEFLDGTLGQNYHFPGRIPTGTDLANYVHPDGKTYKNYQVSDTCTYIGTELRKVFTHNKVDIEENIKYGLLGVWENEDEQYPADFEIVALRGQKVRHHRFPSLTFMRDLWNQGSINQNLATTNTTSVYGVDMLDILGIRLHNNLNPSQYGNNPYKIRAIRVNIAKRNLSNTTVLGTSIVQVSGGNDDTRINTGGNWRVNYIGDTNDDIPIKDDYLRFNCFDLLQDRPALDNVYLRGHYKIKVSGTKRHQYAYSNTERTYGVISHFARGIGNDFLNHPTQLYDGQTIPRELTVGLVTSNDDKIKNVQEALYLGDNLLTTNDAGRLMDNRMSEETVTLKVGGNIDITYPSEGYRVNDSLSTTLYEQTYVASLKKVLKNVFNDMFSQSVVYSNSYPYPDDNTKTTIVFGGDGFVSLYSYVSATRFKLRQDAAAIAEDEIKAIKNIKVFWTIGRHNPSMRSPVSGDTGTYYIPANPLIALNDPILLWPFQSNNYVKPANKFIYDKDFSIPNYLEAYEINRKYEDSNELSYRIWRSLKGITETRYRDGWRVFRPGDYLEISKAKGKITNLTNWGEYILLIQTEKALFRTANDATLKTDGLSVNIGSGDIFQITPKEVNPSNEGVGGTQHKFSGILTPIGYVSVDSELSEVTLYNGENLIDISSGLKADFLKYIRPIPYSGFITTKNMDNPFLGYGISSAYDKVNNRIIISFQGSRSFVASYDIRSKEWRSYHDWTGSYVFNSRRQLYSIKARTGDLYRHNVGPRGVFYGNTYPFFVDVVVNQEPSKEKVLSAFYWISRYILSTGLNIQNTIDYITIRSNKHNTGRIPLIVNRTNSIQEDPYCNCKMVDDKWSFNDIYNRLKEAVYPNFGDLFNDYKVNPNDLEQPYWSDAEPLRDYAFVIRLEFSNLVDHEIRLINYEPLIRLSV